MDLSNLDTVAAADRGAVLQLRHPKTGVVLTDEGTGEPITITLLGSDSKSYQDFVHRARNKRLQAGGGRRRATRTSEEIDAEQLDLTVRCTIAWKHIVYNGQPVEFSSNAVRKLYIDRPWVREQVEEFIEDRANFLGN